MKGGRSPSRFEKSYALRRVLYDTLVGAKSVVELPRVRRDYAMRESLKVSALIMARNLNAFFFHTDYGHCDDIHVGDFDLMSWKPSSNAKLKKSVKLRINKVVGHVVTSKPEPFKNNTEVIDLVVPLIRQSCQFVTQCVSTGAAKYRGLAKQYAQRLNGLLPSLGVGSVPEG